MGEIQIKTKKIEVTLTYNIKQLNKARGCKNTEQPA